MKRRPNAERPATRKERSKAYRIRKKRRQKKKLKRDEYNWIRSYEKDRELFKQGPPNSRERKHSKNIAEELESVLNPKTIPETSREWTPGAITRRFEEASIPILDGTARPDLGPGDGTAVSIRVEIIDEDGNRRWTTVIAATTDLENVPGDFIAALKEIMLHYKAEAVTAISVISFVPEKPLRGEE